MASLTGSKLSLQSYSETKGLETEFAYSVGSSDRHAPDGIKLNPDLVTTSVWDNNDANEEILDGKATVHSTVGHTYQNVMPDTADQTTILKDFQEGRIRLQFIGAPREFPPFRQPLKKATFVCNTKATNPYETNIQLKPLDLYWFWRLQDGNTSLHSGFVSMYIEGLLPIQRICYMDPISRSHTNNDVIRATMVRTMSMAEEARQRYVVVTYDLAIALKAYSIQETERQIIDTAWKFPSRICFLCISW